MPRKGGENAVRIELVAEGAVGAETGPRVEPALRVDVFGVRELEQDRARFLIARIGQESVESGTWHCWQILTLGLSANASAWQLLHWSWPGLFNSTDPSLTGRWQASQSSESCLAWNA